MDPQGIERRRSEGYLPRDEFRAWLEMALARLAFLQKRWTDAGRRYGGIFERFPGTAAAPEAMYWGGVSRYKGSNDHTSLGKTAAVLRERYPASLWAVKASVWLH
jgi:TolA-binding protein